MFCEDLFFLKIPLCHWEQIGVLKAGLIALNILAWNDKIWLLFYFVGYEIKVMINRNSAEVSVLKGQRWNSWIPSRRTTAKAFTKDVFINQERKLGDRRWLDTIVVRRHKRCRLGIVLFISIKKSRQHRMRNQSLWVPGGVWSQGWNLKELTEGHTRGGACGLIWLNTGKLTRSRHDEDWQFESTFLISWVVVHGRS